MTTITITHKVHCEYLGTSTIVREYAEGMVYQNGIHTLKEHHHRGGRWYTRYQESTPAGYRWSRWQPSCRPLEPARATGRKARTPKSKVGQIEAVLAKLEGADRDAAEKLIEELGENLKGARISRGWVTFEFDGRAMLPEQARARAKRIKAAAFGRVGVMGFMVEAAA